MNDTITAAQLLSKQQEVRDLQKRQADAWERIKDAEVAVNTAKAIYDDARWNAEYAESELKSLETALVQGGDE